MLALLCSLMLSSVCGSSSVQRGPRLTPWVQMENGYTDSAWPPGRSRLHVTQTPESRPSVRRRVVGSARHVKAA